jgi:probable rRNA maturation factor
MAASRSKRVQLEVTDRGRPRTARALLRAVVQATLEHAARPGLPVSLLLTDDAEIARIHADHLGDPTPTDVISFDLDGCAELVVSVETAARCARDAGHRLADEVALYVVHGLLHVCGFDDLRAADRKRMRAAERAVLQRLRLRVADVEP